MLNYQNTKKRFINLVGMLLFLVLEILHWIAQDPHLELEPIELQLSLEEGLTI